MVLLLIATFLGLTACASRSVDHEVTVFHDWPADLQPLSFRLSPRPAGADELKWRTWRNIVRQELLKAGFIEGGGSGIAPALEITFDYQVVAKQLHYQRNIYVAPTVHYGYGFRHGGISFSGPLWWSGFPDTYDEIITVNQHRLKLTISDVRFGSPRRIYEGSSVSRSRTAVGLQALPLLMRAILKNFPGESGAVVQVRVESAPEAGKSR